MADRRHQNIPFHSGGIKRRIGHLTVQLLTLIKSLFNLIEHITTRQCWPAATGGRIGSQPATNFSDRCGQPDNWTAGPLQEKTVLWPEDDATTGRENRTGLPEEITKESRFGVSEGGLSTFTNEAGDAASIGDFKRIVRINLPTANFTGQIGGQCRFPSTSIADQNGPWKVVLDSASCIHVHSTTLTDEVACFRADRMTPSGGC